MSDPNSNSSPKPKPLGSGPSPTKRLLFLLVAFAAAGLFALFPLPEATRTVGEATLSPAG